MHKILTIAKREYLASVKTKGFIIGVLLAPVLMGGGFIGIYIAQSQVDTDEKKIVVLDGTGILGTPLLEAAAQRNSTEIYAAQSGRQIEPVYGLEVQPAAAGDPSSHRLSLSDRVRSGELHGFVEIDPGVFGPDLEKEKGIRYFSANPGLDEVRRWIGTAINEALRQRRLADAGVSREAAAEILSWIETVPLELVVMDESGQIGVPRKSDEVRAIGVPIAVSLLMFMMVMMGAVPLLNAVMEEKVQGVAEVVLGSASPFQFMMGKVVGGLAISFTASAVYLGGGVFLLGQMGLAGIAPVGLIVWFVVYMVLAIAMVGALMAALGAACNDARDAQNLALPGLLPTLLPLFLLIPIIEAPNGTLSTWMSFVPPLTPVVMAIRLATPEGVPAWQPWVGLVLVILMTGLTIWVGGRIFRVGLLLRGQPPTLGKLIRWALRG